MERATMIQCVRKWRMVSIDVHKKLYVLYVILLISQAWIQDFFVTHIASYTFDKTN